jgi:D-glycero-beta-D-manno-heptose 1-phosphate adenylyltransferase
MNSIELQLNKIQTSDSIKQILSRLKFLGKKIVFTNGCFDIIHKGHVNYLANAADFGDILIIGLNSDNSVKRLKGENRPIQNQEARAQILASMFFISYVIIFEEDTPYNLIDIIRPDVLVKGGDYKEIDKIVGYDIVKANGGDVFTIPFVDGFSSTSIMDKINKL